MVGRRRISEEEGRQVLVAESNMLEFFLYLKRKADGERK
jgi:hypothetical protein